jgi:hypothetical protein
MKASDLAAYFTKKIAKPIVFDIGIKENSSTISRRYYSIEPTAVSDGVVHVVVNYKHEMSHRIKTGTARFLGDMEIPLGEDDTVEDILTMAVAGTSFGEESKWTETSGDPDRIKNAYAELARRLEELYPRAKP